MPPHEAMARSSPRTVADRALVGALWGLAVRYPYPAPKGVFPKPSAPDDGACPAGFPGELRVFLGAKFIECAKQGHSHRAPNPKSGLVLGRRSVGMIMHLFLGATLRWRKTGASRGHAWHKVLRETMCTDPRRFTCHFQRLCSRYDWAALEALAQKDRGLQGKHRGIRFTGTRPSQKKRCCHVARDEQRFLPEKKSLLERTCAISSLAEACAVSGYFFKCSHELAPLACLEQKENAH